MTPVSQPRRWTIRAVVGAGLVILSAPGCRDLFGPDRQLPGEALVTVVATGLDLPSLFLVLDGGFTKGVPASGNLVLRGLSPGTHTVLLSTAPNCSVAGDNPRFVTISAGAATTVGFEMECVATTGVLQMDVATTGIDFPATLLRRINTNLTPLPPTSLSTVGNLPPGTHVVGIEGLTPNCLVSDGNPRSVSLTAGTLTRDTAVVQFEVTCTATTAAVEVGFVTTGEDIDGAGYVLQVGTIPARQALSNAKYVLNGIPGGAHVVRLDSVATNCTIAGDNPRSVSVVTGGMTRDTARTTFSVACAKVERIAFSRDSSGARISVINEDGSNAFSLGLAGWVGSWSPDGKRLVASLLDCDYWYYYYGCAALGVFIVSVDRLPAYTFRQLTSDWKDSEPAMSPNGRTVAFVRGDAILTIDAEDLVLTPIVDKSAILGMSQVASPAWSPDGTRIAFACTVGANWQDICIANADGTNASRLTADPYYDANPAWSPDGTRIVFESNRGTTDGKMHVAVMSPTGSDFVQLSPGYSPSWSRDGTKIVFRRPDESRGLFIMKADGTMVTRLTIGYDYAPVWRP